MYVLAAELRALLPGGIGFGGFDRQVAAGALLSATLNNLPVAAALHSATVGAAWGGVVGAAIGPNLFMTGSIATIVCRRIAREGGADLTLQAFTKLGVGLVPVQVAAAWAGLLATGALRR